MFQADGYENLILTVDVWFKEDQYQTDAENYIDIQNGGYDNYARMFPFHTNCTHLKCNYWLVTIALFSEEIYGFANGNSDEYVNVFEADWSIDDDEIYGNYRYNIFSFCFFVRY